jgi:AcrR family transcriptional regulator
MTVNTKKTIEAAAKELFATHGYSGLSMRRLAEATGVSLSVTYHYHEDKDSLLKRLFDTTVKQLGERRAQLESHDSAEAMLRDRIAFQIDNALDIVFVLKYYLHFRDHYTKHAQGYLPPTAYLHITEVLEVGIDTDEITLEQSIDKEAKVIAHAINGFLLEYFPASPSPSEREDLISSIHGFIWRALERRGALSNTAN